MNFLIEIGKLSKNSILTISKQLNLRHLLRFVRQQIELSQKLQNMGCQQIEDTPCKHFDPLIRLSNVLYELVTDLQMLYLVLMGLLPENRTIDYVSCSLYRNHSFLVCHLHSSP